MDIGSFLGALTGASNQATSIKVALRHFSLIRNYATVAGQFRNAAKARTPNLSCRSNRALPRSYDSRHVRSAGPVEPSRLVGIPRHTLAIEWMRVRDATCDDVASQVVSLIQRGSFLEAVGEQRAVRRTAHQRHLVESDAYVVGRRYPIVGGHQDDLESAVARPFAARERDDGG